MFCVALNQRFVYHEGNYCSSVGVRGKIVETLRSFDKKKEIYMHIFVGRRRKINTEIGLQIGVRLMFDTPPTNMSQHQLL